MPKEIFYRTNAIIYFQGDVADGIPILKEGKVELSYQDLQTGSEIREPVKVGEFFGVKANLGNYPHDETAMALSDCTVVNFSVAEFEKVVANNPRILMKMMQVFSTQLRRIHHQVQNLLSSDRISTSPEAGLFAVGEYYLKEKQYAHAGHAFRNYLKHWPTGIYAPQATLKAGEAESLQSASIDSGASGFQQNQDPEFAGMDFTEVNNQYKTGHFKEALKGFLYLIKTETDPEKLSNAEFRAGCCLYHLKRYPDAVKQLAGMIRKYPQHTYLGEALYYIGLSNKQMGDLNKALGFLRKAGQLVPEGGSFYRKVVDTIRAIEEEL